MTTTALQSASPAPPNTWPGAKKQTRKQKSRTGALHPSSRFFLAKNGHQGDVPLLDREIVDSECDAELRARFEALKEGVTFIEVVEWKPVFDASGREGTIGKEAVTHKRMG